MQKQIKKSSTAYQLRPFIDIFFAKIFAFRLPWRHRRLVVLYFLICDNPRTLGLSLCPVLLSSLFLISTPWIMLSLKSISYDKGVYLKGLVGAFTGRDNERLCVVVIGLSCLFAPEGGPPSNRYDLHGTTLIIRRKMRCVGGRGEEH